jgi:3-deoxy-D-arabino-heptulosonate 7-phosphate (DAHP) synthase class II
MVAYDQLRQSTRFGEIVSHVADHHLESWRHRIRAQAPGWTDGHHVRWVCSDLRNASPIVAESEIVQLKSDLAFVERGQGFFLQGGDCAETFGGSCRSHLVNNMRTLMQMSTIIESTTSLEVVRVGRIAGQFAKPRSHTVDAQGMIPWRGDIVNSRTATHEARRPDPVRMREAHAHSVRALSALRDAFPVDRFYTSHEALILEYEASLTKRCSDGWNDLSAHHLWIGDRTRQPNGAHVDFLSKVTNPVGVKIGPAAAVADVLELCRRLNPRNVPGRLTLTTRLGSDRVLDLLPEHVDAVRSAGHSVIWQCDPMHANVVVLDSGYRTRPFEKILEEVDGFHAVHRSLGTHAGGLHLELSGENVSECVGGSLRPVGEADVPSRYETAMDPRLNHDQAVELAESVAEIIAHDMKRSINGVRPS